MSRDSTIGQVYLLHFDPPVAHAQHYLGWALDAMARVDEHLRGAGAALVRAAVARGSHVELVRVWREVDRAFERRLKNGGTLKRVCPICKPAYNASAAASMRRFRERKRALERDSITLGDLAKGLQNADSA